MDLIKVMHERRSIRKYLADPVPNEVIIEILDAARWAPSWANTQVPRFVVVKDQNIKTALRDVLTPYNPAREAMIEAPCLICIVAQKGLAGFRKGEATTDKGDWFMFDSGIAMEHIVLAAWNFGLGTVHIGSFDAKRGEEILKIPEGFSLVEMTPLGYFDVEPKAPPRRPLKESVSLDVFGQAYLP